MKVSSAMGLSFEPHIESVFPVLQAHMGHTSRLLRKYVLKTFQHLIAAKPAPANVSLFARIFDLFALRILTANKDQNVKELKLLFKELYHCMKVVSENEQPEHQYVFESMDKLKTFGSVMKNCLTTVAQRKQE